MTDELDQLRQKRLQELQDMQQQAAEHQSQVQQLETIIKTKMTKEAIQRFGNIKAADPEKATQLLVLIGQLAQSGQIIDDEKLKNLLMRLTPKKDFTITRK